MFTLKTVSVFGLSWLLSIGIASAQESKSELTLVLDGNKVFSEKHLLEVANKCLGEAQNKSSALEYCGRRVQVFLQSKGYLKAVVTVPAVIDQSLPIVLSVDEGSRYRLGDITITGTKIFTPAQILPLSDLKSGDVANGDAIGEWLFERVKRAYDDLGYIQFTAEPVPHFREKTNESSDAVVDFEINVDEGPAFTVRTIGFEGNGTIPHTRLLREMLLRPGEFYSRQRYEDSIKRINQLELFETIDADKDVDLKSDDEISTLDITIKLKKKS